MTSNTIVTTLADPIGTLARRAPSNLSIREVVKEDLDKLLKIEQDAFEYPWTRQEFAYCLGAERCGGLVLERDGETLGYLFYERRASSFRLLNCAVATNAQRRGFGSAIIRALMKRLDGRRTEISCVVRERNVPAQLFLKNLGFRAVWINHDYYSEINEDAYRMSFKTEEWALTTDYVRQRLMPR